MLSLLGIEPLSFFGGDIIALADPKIGELIEMK
jgi:hypothetical protein